MKYKIPYDILNKYFLNPQLDINLDISKALENKVKVVISRIEKYSNCSFEEIKENLQKTLTVSYACQEAERVREDLHTYKDLYYSEGKEALYQEVEKCLLDAKKLQKEERIRADFALFTRENPSQLYDILSFMGQSYLLEVIFKNNIPSSDNQFLKIIPDTEIKQLFLECEGVFKLFTNLNNLEEEDYTKQFMQIFKLHYLNFPKSSFEDIARDAYNLIACFCEENNVVKTLTNAENFFKANHIEVKQLKEYLPEAPINLLQWQKIIRKYPSISTLRLFKHAQALEQHLKEEGKIKKSIDLSFFSHQDFFNYKDLNEAILTVAYGKNYFQDEELARFCNSRLIPKKIFERALLLRKLYKDYINENDILSEPITSEEIGLSPGYELRVLKECPEYLFLGEIVNNCQSIGKLGEAYVLDSIAFENRSIYVLVKTTKGEKSDIVGNGIVLSTRAGNYCIDSWENLRSEDDEIIKPLLLEFAKRLLEKHHCLRVTIGTGAECRTPDDFKKYPWIPDLEEAAGGFHSDDSRHSQTIISMNTKEIHRLVTELNIPENFLKRITSYLQIKMIEGLAKNHPDYFKKLLADQEKFVAITSLDAFNHLFLAKGEKTDDFYSEDDFNILIKNACEQGIIKEFLTSGGPLLNKLEIANNPDKEKELLALAEKYHCLKELFRNNDMAEVINTRCVEIYLQYPEYFPEIFYSAKFWRMPNLLNFIQHIDQIKKVAPQTIISLLLNDPISLLLEECDKRLDEDFLDTMFILAEKLQVAPHVLSNISYFDEIDSFKRNRPDYTIIALIVEYAERHGVLYDLLNKKAAYEIVHAYKPEEFEWIMYDIDKKMPKLFEDALKQKNFIFIWQWGFEKHTSKHLNNLLKANPPILIEMLEYFSLHIPHRFGIHQVDVETHIKNRLPDCLDYKSPIFLKKWLRSQGYYDICDDNAYIARPSV